MMVLMMQNNKQSKLVYLFTETLFISPRANTRNASSPVLREQAIEEDVPPNVDLQLWPNCCALSQTNCRTFQTTGSVMINQALSRSSSAGRCISLVGANINRA